MYTDAFLNALIGSAQWTWKSILFQVPWSSNYFWGLTLLSLIIWGLELLFPWRKDQKPLRKDFWLDGFYMYFNFFVFSVAISGFYKAIGLFFGSIGISMQSLALLDLKSLPAWIQLLLFFVLLDFVQWFTHVLLHKVPWFWRFHQVHHSVKEMGFAAHLRYHWMENLLYKPLKTVGLMLLGGLEPEQAYIVHFTAIAIGHLNHANIRITWGPLKYLLNNSVMHLYHHAYNLPDHKPYGMNFGISLSVWDYIFGTAHVPDDNAHIQLGYPGDEHMPDNFMGQLGHGFNAAKPPKRDSPIKS
jgi:sterol desaturase/sphingolipid hydroxylase (fatty acid hydroxylase superfamily)